MENSHDNTAKYITHLLPCTCTLAEADSTPRSLEARQRYWPRSSNSTLCMTSAPCGCWRMRASGGMACRSLVHSMSGLGWPAAEQSKVKVSPWTKVTSWGGRIIRGAAASRRISWSQSAHIDRSVQERHHSTALALELHLSCTNPSISSQLEMRIDAVWILPSVFSPNFFHFFSIQECRDFSAFLSVRMDPSAFSPQRKCAGLGTGCSHFVWAECVNSVPHLGLPHIWALPTLSCSHQPRFWPNTHRLPGPSPGRSQS